MKKFNLGVILFVVPIVLIGILNLVIPKTAKLSELENRNLALKPEFSIESMASGKYFRDFESYFTDHFIMRERMVKLGMNINELKGIKTKEEVSIVSFDGANVFESQLPIVEDDIIVDSDKSNDDILAGDTQDDDLVEEEMFEENPLLEESKSNTKTPNENNVEKQVGSVFIINDKIMEIFKSNETAGKAYSNVINEFSNKLNDDIKIYSMLIPTQIEFMNSTKYNDLSSSQFDAINYVNSHFNNRVEPINVYDSLKQNSDHYIYFRSDHHWTALGAYYAYRSFINQLGEKPIALNKYEIDKVEDYLGSLYSITLDKNVKDSPDTIYLYKPFIEHEYHIYYEGPLKMDVLDMSHATKERKYRIFLSGDRPWGRIKTEVDNGKKIAVIKDSYGNAFVPFLIPHYEEIYIIDPRQFTLNIDSFIKDKEIDQILFLNYVMVTGNTGFSDTLQEMFNNK